MATGFLLFLWSLGIGGTTARSALADAPNGSKTIHLIANGHIDPVWLWDWREGAAVTVSTFRVAAESAGGMRPPAVEQNRALAMTIPAGSLGCLGMINYGSSPGKPLGKHGLLTMTSSTARAMAG